MLREKERSSSIPHTNLFGRDGINLAFSGERGAVSFPPKTQPVSMFIVRLNQSGSGTGVWP